MDAPSVDGNELALRRLCGGLDPTITNAAVSVVMRYSASPLRLNCRLITEALVAELPREVPAETLWMAGRCTRRLSKPPVAEHCLARVGAFRRGGDDMVDGVFVDLTVRQFDPNGPALVVYDSIAELAETWAVYFADGMEMPRGLRVD